MHRSIMALLFILVFCTSLLAQANLKFGHLTVKEGLSNNFIRDIAQDSIGFMWFATEDGLNKYDGYRFTVYRHDPNDSTSLSENKVETLSVDKNGILWVGTNGGGLNAFNPETEEFIHFNMDPDNPNDVSKENIYDMYLDKNSRIWFSIQGKGLYRLDPGTNEIKHFAHNPDDLNTISSNIGLTISETVENGKEIFWFGSWGGGFNKFDPKNNSWTHYWHDPNNRNSLSSNFLTKIYTGKSGLLWITTGQNGLDKLDTKTGRFTNYRYDPDNPHSLSGNRAHEVLEQDDILWITTMSGLSRLDIKNKRFKSYYHDPSDPGSIGQNSVSRIFKSKGDLIWIGGWSGIDIIDFEQKPFVSYQRHPNNANSLSDNFVVAILETGQENDKTLWVGTKDGGLNKIDRETGEFTHFRHNPYDSNSLSDNFVFSITESSIRGKKELWMATMSGLNRFDQHSGTFTHYRHNPADTTSISEDLVYKVYAGRNGIIWLGTGNRGLCRFDPDTEKFTRYHHRAGEIWTILEDASGFLWHGSVTRGLIKLNPSNNNVTYYMNNPQDSSSISSNTIRSIHESVFEGKHVLWIGTNAGLNRFDYETETFYRFTQEDGLPSDEINGILEDRRGNLWLGTGLGLAKLDPVSGSIRNYDENDGLPGSQFLRGSYSIAKNGEMFLGSTSGMISFFPDQIKDNPHVPQIVLTDFQIFNKSVQIKKDSPSIAEDYFLPKHINDLKQIEVAYHQSIFSIEFAALDFRKPQKNQYAYKMENVDPEWVYTDASRRFATYTNLDPGEYTFRVKGSNNDGIWNKAGKSIKVIIIPPWWQSQIAYILYFLIFLALVIVAWRLQVRRIQIRQQIQMERFEAEKLREMDNLKSRFFANISHEFRTPLTLIKGPVKQMLEDKFIGNIKDQYKMILRNSDRLLSLINQILDLSKLESGEIKLKVAETDIVKHLNGILLSISSLADNKKVSLKFSSTVNSMIGYVDHDKVEKIVSNLLSNAFKFTPEGGVVVVNLSTVIPAKAGIQRKNWIPHQVRDDNGKFIQISVSNTGPGIPSEKLDKIFDRFYSAPLDKKSLNNRNADDGYPTGQDGNSYQKDGEGTGIGLALTKELVETCHGEISVNSVLGGSTTFKAVLPIAKEIFKDNEIVETTPKISPVNKRGLRGVSIAETDTTKAEQDFISDRKKSLPLVLIVEDNPDVTSYISSFMENDYRILNAENGKEGIKKTLDKYPDLIISDVMMPEMDGFELCKKIKTNERISHIPVILLTAKADLDSKIEGLKFGADDYVTKPFEARELQIRVKNLIEQRRKLREKFSALIDLNLEDIAASSMDEQLLQRLLNVFEDHMEEPDFSIEQLAQEIGISRKHLNRKIQAITNLSTSDFIRTLRLKKAAHLLKNASGTISEIAYKVGFNNLSYFSKVFRKHFGKLPSDFVKS